MPHYQRIAVMILRLAATLWSGVLAIMWLLYGAERAAGVDVQHYPLHVILGGIAYVCLGLLAGLWAKPLVRLASRGLDG